MSNETVATDQQTDSQNTALDTSAQEPSIDDILSEIDKEFDADTKTPEPTEDQNELSELRNTVDHLMNQTTTQDIDKAVDVISGSIDNVPKRAIRGMLNDMAASDPRLKKAFDNRHNDPTSWNKVLKAAGKNIQKEFSGLPDKALTDDQNAVSAAVQGASKTNVDDEAPNFSKMTDAQYEEWKMEQ